MFAQQQQQQQILYHLWLYSSISQVWGLWRALPIQIPEQHKEVVFFSSGQTLWRVIVQYFGNQLVHVA